MIKQNRNLIFLFIALCLISVGIGLLDQYRGQGIDPGLFRLPTDVVIDEIVLRKGADSVKITGGSGGWNVNARYEADLDRVRLMFAVMDRARPRRLAGDSIAARFGDEAVFVHFKEKKNEILSLKIWGDGISGYTWFMDPAEAIPAEMVIPGYRSSLINVFSTREEDWRDKRIFNFNWRNFEILEMDFSGQKEEGFTISVEDGLLTIKDVPVPDTTRLKSYMDAVQLLEAESMLSFSAAKRDSLLAIRPSGRLILHEISGKKHELRIYSGGLALRDSLDLMVVGLPAQNLLRVRRKAFAP